MRNDDRLIQADRSARRSALDVTRSYIVQAPAGSGKTELLIQRYLRLLAIVKHPEEVVAITFTRKAAAEMRIRVLAALSIARGATPPDKPHERLTFEAATAILERDAELGWQLTDFPRRMRIQTLDALAAGIARSMPLSSALGGTPVTLADAEMRDIYRSAAAATLDWLAASDRIKDAIERVLIHLDNNAGVYIDYVARMLETRDQWLGFVGSGESGGGDIESVRAGLEQRISDVVGERLRRVRDLMPDGLVRVLPGLARYAAGNLQPGNPGGAPNIPGDPDGLPGTDPRNRKRWCAIADLLLTANGTWRRTVTKRDGFPATDNGEKKQMLALLGGLAEFEALRLALHRVRDLPPHRYSDEQWEVLLALLGLLPLAVSELRRIFAERGVADHTEIALAANLALGDADDPGDMALLLDYQIRHLLIDEMQDTSISQYHFLQKLVAGWEEGDGRTLFCVGDPMQSIYRFRNAEVGQFLVARERGIADLPLEPLLLRRNFRSGEALVNWFNDAFRQGLPPEDDISAGAIAYSEAVAVEDHADSGLCRIYPVFGSSVDAEARQGIDILESLLDADGTDSIAVLVRSRTILPPLLAGLRHANIDYQAVEIDRLTDLPEVIDILALTRALCHQGDRIAWLALLRGPWVGLTWADLHRIVRNDAHTAVWDLLRDDDVIARLSSEGAASVHGFVRTMQQQLRMHTSRSLRDRVEIAWFALGGPAILRNVDELDKVYRFLTVVAKFETAGTLDDVAGLESLLDAERVSGSAGITCRVQVMTMHRAKGLQFDHVLLYGLGRSAGSSDKSVLSWLNIPGRQGDMILSPVGSRAELEHDPLHRFIEVSEADKDLHEQARLLYVACTRARQSLHLSGNVRVSSDGRSFRPPRSGSLLRHIWPSVQAAFEEAFKAQVIDADAAEENRLVDPLVRRFDSPWSLPGAPALPVSAAAGAEMSADDMVDYHWVGSSARHAGTIVHRWLQKAAEGSVQLDAAQLSRLRPVSMRWAERLAAASNEIDGICDRVEAALRGVLSDTKGRWSVYGDGHVELPVSGLWNGRIETVVIDRVRIDDDGVHWIIDYKTGTHEGADLAGFLDQESQRYRPQLEKYAALYGELTDAPLRTALYFPLLQEFLEIPVRGQFT